MEEGDRWSTGAFRLIFGEVVVFACMDFREMVALWYRSSPWRLCSSLTPIISIPVGRAMCILNVFASRRKLGLVISKAIVVVCSMHYQVFALSVLLSKLSSISHAGRSRSVESIPLNEYVFVRHRRTLHKCSRFADNSVVT